MSRFEIEEGTGGDNGGDPRSLLFRFEFTDNEHFENTILEKRFWQRRSKGGWSGLVSEPVEIRWEKGKDLTGGLLATVKKVWDARQAKAGAAASVAPTGSSKTPVVSLTADEKLLKKKIENTGLGGMSFFAWFGYVGRDLSAEESREATEKARRDRLARQQQGSGSRPTSSAGEKNDMQDDEEDDEDGENELEIFPEGENLAIALAEDLWPNAIKYFTQAQEQDEVSDDDFESEAGDDDKDEKEGEEEQAYSDEEPPAKRLKT